MAPPTSRPEALPRPAPVAPSPSLFDLAPLEQLQSESASLAADAIKPAPPPAHLFELDDLEQLTITDGETGASATSERLEYDAAAEEEARQFELEILERLRHSEALSKWKRRAQETHSNRQRVKETK